MELRGRLGHQVICKGEGEYRMPSWPGGDANAVILRMFVKDTRCNRTRVTSSFGEGFRIFATKAIPEYILAMICEDHYLAVSED